MAQRTPAITPNELAFALKVADAAAGAKIPMSGVGDKAVSLDMGDGTISDITFNDTPAMRAMFAIKEQFGKNWGAVMMRAWAFAHICDNPGMDKFRWTPEGALNAKIDDAIVEVASVMPLNPNGQFNANAFFKRAHKIMEDRAGPTRLV